MPVHRVKGGWQWGQTGKVYPTLHQAERQARAIYAAGYRGDQGNRSHQRRAAQLLKASARAEKRFERDVLRVTRGVHEGIRGAIDVAAPALTMRHSGGPGSQPKRGWADGVMPVCPARVAPRLDASKIFPPGMLERLFVYVRRGVAPAFDRMAKTVDADNEEALSLFGIVAPKAPVGLAGILAHAREEAIRRVQGAAKGYVDQVRAILDDPENVGLRVEELADLLEERAGVSASRAAFVARDTTLRTNAAITKQRQTAAGITEYRWSTSRDERVRKTHAELEGERFAYDDPPITNEEGDTNNPGEDWQCRCVALPVLVELEEPGGEEGEETAA